jgi:hypothetical protein
VKIALRVAAHQLAVLGECDVALDPSRTHARGGEVGLLRVLRKLERGAAVPDREGARPRGLLAAALELAPQRAGPHGLDEVVGTRSDIDASHAGSRVARRSIGPGAERCRDESGDQQGADPRLHRGPPLIATESRRSRSAPRAVRRGALEEPPVVPFR